MFNKVAFDTTCLFISVPHIRLKLKKCTNYSLWVNVIQSLYIRLFCLIVNKLHFPLMFSVSSQQQ